MRSRDLIALGFPGVCARIADLAVSASGQEACRSLRPTSDPSIAEEGIEAAWQSFSLFEKHGDPPLAPFHDLSESLAAARHEGFVLDGKALVRVRRVLEIARAVGSFLRQHRSEIATVAPAADRLKGCPTLEKLLARALDDKGNVLDHASDELARARATIRRLRDTLTKRLENLVSRSGTSDVFADDYITVRNNRFVVPIRTAAASRFGGVVQDRSISGETLFVEPLFAVELNNNLLMAVREEEAAVRRILADLTTLVRSDREQIADNLQALIDVDCLTARARFARTYQCTRPTFTADAIELRDARHPGLLFTGRPVTPIDLDLPAEHHALVISGPNTGGKTVALKTLGLSVLMAQSGILIPAAEGARLPCVPAVFTDIGDDQNVERNLSTFSAHIVNLTEILAAGPPGALVLLDEPGVGTDPEEGAALAIGLIEEFERRQAKLVITTHYGPVKVFALGRPSCRVAAVDFDVDTLSAGYRLVYHSLGSSLALPIARRLGLPEAVLERAEAARSEQSRAFANALDSIEKSRRQLEEERSLLRSREAELVAGESRVQQLQESLREKHSKAWETELREARAFLRTLKTEGHAELRAIRGKRDERERFTRFVQAQDKAIDDHVAQSADKPHPAGSPETASSGDLVEVGDRRIRGELLSIDGERAWIQRGSLRFEVPAAELRMVGRRDKAAPRVEARLGGSGESDDAPTQLIVVGYRTRDALPEVERFLDRAARARQDSVRIVHGVGSGALRRAIQDYLSGSPYCSEFRSGQDGEGGAGVTIVEVNT